MCPVGQTINLYFKLIPSEDRIFEGALELTPFSRDIDTSIHCAHLFQDKTSRVHDKISQIEMTNESSIAFINRGSEKDKNDVGSKSAVLPSKKLNPDLFNLIIVWEALDGPVTGLFGQHHMLELLTRIPRSNKIKDKLSFLRLHLESETKIMHDFSTTPVCKVRIKFLMFNTSPKQPFSVSLVALKPHESVSQSDDSYASKRAHYFWSGKSFQDSIIDPKSELAMEADACFISAGTFNINRFRIRVSEPDSKNHEYLPTSTLQHIVQINEP